MSEGKGRQVTLSNSGGQLGDKSLVSSAEYREEIINTIDDYRYKIQSQRMDRTRIKNRLKLLKMRDEAMEVNDLTRIEKVLWEMAVDIEEPTFRMQRNIAWIVVGYTVLAFASFLALNIFNRIMLPSFNIPYSVLLMGLLGSLVSMYVKLPNLRVSEPLSYDQTVWFIINPPIAVIMAGIFFGLIQIFLPLLPVSLADESWPFWIIAWVVGLNNWVHFYEKLIGKRRRTRHSQVVKTENVRVVKKESLTTV
jgi:hypothetical protein